MQKPQPVHELAILQAIRLKGRIGEAALAETLGSPRATVAAALDDLTRAGLTVSRDPVRLSDAGRGRCNELLAAERATANAHALATTYGVFHVINAEFKALVTEWQFSHDAEVLERLDGIHRRVVPIIAAVAEQLPRLGAYSDKLEAALQRITAGDTSWLARPMVDSYHTVWFELHQELIQACGLTRRGDD